MKIIPRHISVIALCGVLSGFSATYAQTVMINSLSGTKFCEGDPIKVDFTATGVWGHNNAFALQLSDTSGSFNGGFQNIGALQDTASGTYTISASIPSPLAPSAHYRVRLVAAYPYVVSGDNGTDLSVGAIPDGFVFYTGSGYADGAAVGTPTTFIAMSEDLNSEPDAHDTATWDFGPGATPASAIVIGYNHQNMGFSYDVTYSTSGDRTVSLTIARPGGCPGTKYSGTIHVFDCSNPSVPHDAIVIDSNQVSSTQNRTYWVNPGVTFYLNDGDTVFAETGANIVGGTNRNTSQCIIYVKPGAVLNLPHGSSNSVIYANDASISVHDAGDFTLNCPDLAFDYTNAPPNKIVTDAVQPDVSNTPIDVFPNPTTGTVAITGLPQSDLKLTVLDLLGATVLEQQNIHSTDASLNVSALAPGVYYLRIASAHSVLTKKLVKQ